MVANVARERRRWRRRDRPDRGPAPRACSCSCSCSRPRSPSNRRRRLLAPRLFGPTCGAPSGHAPWCDALSPASLTQLKKHLVGGASGALCRKCGTGCPFESGACLGGLVFPWQRPKGASGRNQCPILCLFSNLPRVKSLPLFSGSPPPCSFCGIHDL